MTPEQHQRIKQIRDRRVRVAASDRPFVSPTWDDIDFLLSLVKEQEAESEKQRECHAAIADSFRYGWNVNNTCRQVAETIAAAIRAEKGSFSNV